MNAPSEASSHSVVLNSFCFGDTIFIGDTSFKIISFVDMDFRKSMCLILLSQAKYLQNDNGIKFQILLGQMIVAGFYGLFVEE